MSGVVRTGLNVAGSGLSMIGSGLSQAAPALTNQVQDQLRQQGIQLDLGDLQNELETALRQTGKTELQPENLKQQAQG
ncbi:hypothetical protein KQH20_31000, partial [Streptomyces sp. CHA16]|nr:hypothetical protein [Streptomyces sp. CHA16]